MGSGHCTLRSAYFACQIIATNKSSTPSAPFLCNVMMPDDNLYLMQDGLYGSTYNESLSIDNVIVIYRNETSSKKHYSRSSCCHSCIVNDQVHMCSFVYIDKQMPS